MSGYRFRPLTQSDADAIAAWEYPEPYSFYNWSADPDDLAELLSPALRGDRYYAVDEAGSLAGFFSFKRLDPGTVEIGLGLHPDRTGRGLGRGFLEAGLAFGSAELAAERFVLSVAAFNRRAITVYERAGFVAVRSYPHFTNGGVWEFVEMARRAGGPPSA